MAGEYSYETEKMCDWGRLPGQMHNKSQGFMYINIQKVYGWGVLPGQINESD